MSLLGPGLYGFGVTQVEAVERKAEDGDLCRLLAKPSSSSNMVETSMQFLERDKCPLWNDLTKRLGGSKRNTDPLPNSGDGDPHFIWKGNPLRG